MNSWGGQRKGAGRPKGSKKELKVKATFYLLPESKVFIDSHQISNGEVIDNLIKLARIYKRSGSL